MSILLNGDCLEEMENLDNESIDLIFCDLPYGQTSCKWDCLIDIDKLWIQFMRVKKLNTPIIMTCTTKFGLSLLNSCPKKCPFRYDLVWCKSAPTGFLSAKKMPMRKHEMIYVFYEKLPFYDLSSHKHKFMKEKEEELDEKYKNKGGLYSKVSRNGLLKAEPHYDPPLPTSLIKENGPEPEPEPNEDYDNREIKSRKTIKKEEIYAKGYLEKKVNFRKYDPTLGGKGAPSHLYDPPLPTSLLEIKSTKGKHSTEKPVSLMSWILKYYSKEGDVVFDPTMGSGSMGVACKEMNRDFIGIEKDEEIYSVAVNRIE